MKRVMTKKHRKRFQNRFAKRNAKRVRPREYHSPCTKRDGSRGWSGGRDLSLSAAYTKPFCKAVFDCWTRMQPQQFPNLG